MKICIVTNVSADLLVSERSYESFKHLDYPVFWVCFNDAGLKHATASRSASRGDVIVDYSKPPFSELYLNEASYCFFRQYGAKIWAAFDVVAIPQDDVAYGSPSDLPKMASAMLAENIVLAMPSFHDGPNITMPHVASQREKGIRRRYNTFIEELGWIVNTQLMPLDFFTLAYCFSKSSWGKEQFLCSHLIRRFGPWSCAIFDEFPAHHLRAPLAKHGNAEANHLYRRLTARFGIRHPAEAWGRIREKENIVCIPVDLGLMGMDGRKRPLASTTSPIYAGTPGGMRMPVHPEYWLPRQHGDVPSLRRLLETDPEHIDYRMLDAILPKQAPGSKEIKKVSLAEFHDRFGTLDTSPALHGLTVPRDAHVVLTLLYASQAKRVLEIGTAAGHMTANFTRWTAEDAKVFSMGLTTAARTDSLAYQRNEDPSPDQFGRFVDHFGLGAKATLFACDSTAFDFSTIAPLDFVFVDGAHDAEHVWKDSLNAYEALRPGGYLVWHDVGSATPWVEVKQTLERLPFAETISHVDGTEVAFLIKPTTNNTRRD